MTIIATFDTTSLQTIFLKLQRIAKDVAIQEAAAIALKDIRSKTAKGIGFDNKRFTPYMDERWKAKREARGLTTKNVTLSFNDTMLSSIALRGSVLAPSEDEMLKAVGNQENTRQRHRNRKFMGAGDDTVLKIEKRISFLCERAGK